MRPEYGPEAHLCPGSCRQSGAYRTSLCHSRRPGPRGSGPFGKHRCPGRWLPKWTGSGLGLKCRFPRPRHNFYPRLPPQCKSRCCSWPSGRMALASRASASMWIPFSSGMVVIFGTALDAWAARTSAESRFACTRMMFTFLSMQFGIGEADLHRLPLFSACAQLSPSQKRRGNPAEELRPVEPSSPPYQR